jgi:hypothetical protein
MEIALYVYLILVLIGLIAFIHSIKNAQEVNPNEPFIHGDYDPRKQ